MCLKHVQVNVKPTHIYQPAPLPVSPEPPADRRGPPCFPPTQYLDSHSTHWPVTGLKIHTDSINSNKDIIKYRYTLDMNNSCV